MSVIELPENRERIVEQSPNAPDRSWMTLTGLAIGVVVIFAFVCYRWM